MYVYARARVYMCRCERSDRTGLRGAVTRTIRRVWGQRRSDIVITPRTRPNVYAAWFRNDYYGLPFPVR